MANRLSVGSFDDFAASVTSRIGLSHDEETPSRGRDERRSVGPGAGMAAPAGSLTMGELDHDRTKLLASLGGREGVPTRAQASLHVASSRAVPNFSRSREDQVASDFNGTTELHRRPRAGHRSPQSIDHKVAQHRQSPNRSNRSPQRVVDLFDPPSRRNSFDSTTIAASFDSTARSSADSARSTVPGIWRSTATRPSVPESDSSTSAFASSQRLKRDAPVGKADSKADGSTEGSSAVECGACDTYGYNRNYCNVCQTIYCDRCWDQQAPHRKGRNMGSGGVPHEKTDHNVAKKVQDVLEPNLTDAARDKLHIQDIDTTWFGVVRVDNELPLFRDYGRYANLIAELKNRRGGPHITASPRLSISSDESETLYPSLVSFVGETGAGKSSLIKFLIDLNSEETEWFDSPVVGAPGRNLATSEDVHLYLDPDSSRLAGSQAPLLFADCEGLRGGEREPVGARLKRRLEHKSREIPYEDDDQPKRLKHISERALIWALDPHKRSREFAVANLYPRLLYTFSDVIVFALKNPRVIESVLEHLVEWAHAALEKSSNQPILPHAIIALNASENNIPMEQWDVEFATKQILNELSKTVYQNATFKRWAAFWREDGRKIETVEDLIKTYYTSLKVVRIPTQGRPNLIKNQVTKLSETIRWATKAARERKADLRMLLEADELQRYLQTAFDHFAEYLDRPYDFVQASLTNSPIPNNFGGNILKLAIQLMETWSDRGVRNLVYIFEELSLVIASCIMLDATRNKIRGKPIEIFPSYVAHLDDALKNFCDRHWPCEFTLKGLRCVNVRSGHGKGHQAKSGKLLAGGDYYSAFQCNEVTQRQFQNNVYDNLEEVNQRIQRNRVEHKQTEEHAAAEFHRQHVLPIFVCHASNNRPGDFVSHTVCLSCLFEPPEHVLPCGHAICTPCLKIYGTSSRKPNVVEIGECPLEKRANHFHTPWEVYLKPRSCGIRILTLDGGGVRGVVELEILKMIAKEFEDRINIQSFFDLIVGTSTGGLIGLGLTARSKTLEECSEMFETLCQQSFQQRKGANVPGLGFFVKAYNHSKYETEPLKKALIEAFSEDEYLFGGKRILPSSVGVKVAVTATSTSLNGVVLANYNRLCFAKLPYHFQRPDRPNAELKTWEAARATSAAPGHFKPFYHEQSKQQYSDGGIYYNNPIKVADSEWKLIWPDQKDDEPDIVLSIGSGFCKSFKARTSLSRPSEYGIIAHGRNQWTMASNHIHASLNCEATWHEYLSLRNPKEHASRFVRLNPEFAHTLPKLDKVTDVPFLKQTTRFALGGGLQIKDVACRLAATCFYFEVTSDVTENMRYRSESYLVTGSFHCRLSNASEIIALGRFIQKNSVAGHDPHFIIREAGREIEHPQEILLDRDVIDGMIEKHKFLITRIVQIRSSAKSARTEIFLCMTKDDWYPISGCPRKLHAERPTVKVNRQVLTSMNSFRWAGRTTSDPKQWRPSLRRQRSTAHDLIERYADETHLLGSAREEDLQPGPSEEPEPASWNFDSSMASSLRRAKSSLMPLTGTSRPVRLAHDQERPLKAWVDTLAAAEDEFFGARPQELPTDQPQGAEFLIVKHDWEPPVDDQGYLALSRGQLIEITGQRPDGFLFGLLATDPKKQGWVPSNCLEAMSSNSTRAPSPIYELA